MYAQECPDCRTLWPEGGRFKLCPQCEVKTRCVAKRPIPPRNADARVAAINFERFYMRRDREREARGEPSPEDLGRLDAARDREEIRRLEEAIQP